jgi:hypothetical protein
MARSNDTQRLAQTEESLTVLFCPIATTPPTRCSTRTGGVTGLSSDSRTLRSSPSPSCSSFVGWSPSAPFCGTPRGFSPTCFREWWGFTLPRSTAG